MKEPGGPAGGTRVRVMLGAAGVALVTLVGAAWVFRLSLADAAVRGALRGAGVDADFRIVAADLGGVTADTVRLGAKAAPDVTAKRARAGLGWGLTGPRLSAIRLVNPVIRVRLDAHGVSLGQLDKLRGGPSSAPPRLPDLRIDIENGRVFFMTPAGVIPATFAAHGRIARDFAATAEIPPVSVRNGSSRIDNLRAAVSANTRNGATILTSDAAVDALAFSGFEGAGVRINIDATAPRDLVATNGSARMTGQSVKVAGVTLANARVEATTRPGAPDHLNAGLHLGADTLKSVSANIDAPDLSITATGDFRQATGEWTAHGADAALGDLKMTEATASGAYSFDGRAADGAVIAATGRMSLPQAVLGPEGRAKIVDAIPAMGGSPIGPLVGSGRTALDRALTRFSTAAAVRLDWRGGAGRMSLPGPIGVEAASGGRMTVTPATPGRPVLMLLLPSGAAESGGRFALEGGGLPPLVFALDRMTLGGGRMEADGAATIAGWAAAGGRLDLSRTTFALRRDGDKGAFKLDGAVALSGATEAIGVTNFRAPVRIDATWGGGFRVMLPDHCLNASADGLTIPGHRLGGRSVSLCTGADNVLVGADAAGRMFGGFGADAVAFAGRTNDKAARPVSIAARRIEGKFVGGRNDAHLELSAISPGYTIDYAADRRIRFTGALMSARTEPAGRIAGVFRGGVLDDPALPANVTAFDARWSAGTEARRTVMRLAGGTARVTDKQPAVAPAAREAAGAPAEWRPRYNPLRVSAIEGALIDGRIEAHGAILLEDGARPLAGFTAKHDLASGRGEAHVTNAGLMFARKKLDLYEITELARGVVDGVEGPVGVDLVAAWDGEGISTRGHISPKNINLNAVSLGPVEGLSGDVELNDLALMTTPPGQTLSLRRLNPGVVVEDGVVTFQMLAPDHIRIEGAKWPFAAGELAVDPQTVVLGGPEFRMNLTLRDVDVEQLLRQLDFKDLTATGTVQGSFPLVFDSNGGRIVHGELRASPAGGTIKYTGGAGEGLVGAPQIAFDALKSFAYNDLVLELDGDLDGDIVSAIRFSGENVQPIGGIVAPGAVPLPGMKRLTVTGWPFRFNVGVRAPFRRLVQTSQGINDARPLVDQAIRDQNKPSATTATPPAGPAKVDPPAPPRR